MTTPNRDKYLPGDRGQYQQKLDEIEIIDPRVPEYWVVGVDDRSHEVVITFPEWANDPGRPGQPDLYEGQ